MLNFVKPVLQFFLAQLLLGAITSFAAFKLFSHPPFIRWYMQWVNKTVQSFEDSSSYEDVLSRHTEEFECGICGSTKGVFHKQDLKPEYEQLAGIPICVCSTCTHGKTNIEALTLSFLAKSYSDYPTPGNV